MIKLVIFDFDGVLVDTELTTFNFYKELLPSYGIALKDSDFQFKIGRKSADFFRDVLKDKFNASFVEEITVIKRQAFQKNIKKYLKPVPGAFKLLADCQRAHLVMAIGSQNERELIEKAVDEFNIRNYFSFITSLQDIKNKKPDPEVYLLVSKNTRIEPKNAVVIEDAPIGIEAAYKGGFRSIAITTSFKREDFSKADLVIDSMTELSPRLLREFS